MPNLALVRQEPLPPGINNTAARLTALPFNECPSGCNATHYRVGNSKAAKNLSTLFNDGNATAFEPPVDVIEALEKSGIIAGIDDVGVIAIRKLAGAVKKRRLRVVPF